MTSTFREQSRPLSRRQFLVGMGGCAATLGLAACARPSAPAPESTRPADTRAATPPAAAPTTASAVRGTQGELVINSFGGSFERAVKAAYVEPFEKEFNARIVVQTAISTETLAKLRAQKGSPQIDVAFMDVVPMTLAIRDDLIDELDLKNVPNFERLYPNARDPERRWVGLLLASTGLVYNPSVVRPAPTSWLDLWKPEFKGKVALPDIAQTAGYQFLIAIARTQGGSETNSDPGFAKIRELQPNVLAFYRQPDQVVALLNQGDVVLAPWYNDRTYAARAAGSPVDYVNPQEGGMLIVSTMGVPRGSKNKALAERFIDFAISKEHQTEFSVMQNEGPTNRDVQLPPEVATLVPYGEQAVGKLYAMDVKAVADALPAWTDRWGREITGG